MIRFKYILIFILPKFPSQIVDNSYIHRSGQGSILKTILLYVISKSCVLYKFVGSCRELSSTENSIMKCEIWQYS